MKNTASKKKTCLGFLLIVFLAYVVCYLLSQTVFHEVYLFEWTAAHYYLCLWVASVAFCFLEMYRAALITTAGNWTGILIGQVLGDFIIKIIQRLLMGAKKRRCMSMSKKRLLSIVVSAVILLSFACTAMAAEKSERYVGDSTVNGSIYQTYYQVDAQTRTGVKKISVSGVLYEKGTIGTWQKVSSCSNSSTTSTCMVSSSFNTKPGKSYRLEYSATFSYSDGRSETITGSTSR